MPFADVRDIRVYYERAGSGPRLLFISGSGGDLRRRPNVFESPLGQEFEILAYDQRGLGQTSIADGPYEMRDYAEDAAGLLDAVGWDRCLVMGTSFGGMVAQEFAVRCPQRVERLVLNCTSSGGAGRPSFPLHELHDLEPEERFRRQLALSDTRRGPEWQAEHADQFAELLEQSLQAAAIGADEPRRREGQRLQLDARSRLDVYDRLPGITAPTLVCSGRYDGIAPPANGRAIASQIPNAQYRKFDGGHLFFIQDKSAYPAMIAFLRGEVAAAAS
jgi:3-oxoadipate enol-lactonase